MSEDDLVSIILDGKIPIRVEPRELSSLFPFLVTHAIRFEYAGNSESRKKIKKERQPVSDQENSAANSSEPSHEGEKS